MNIRPNRIKQKLAAGENVYVVCGPNDADWIDEVGPSELDGIWLEGEHGPVDFGNLGNLTRACDLWDMTSIVRVNRNDQTLIYRTLDRGAQGIVVPHVNTREEAENVVAGGKFAPIGQRGMFVSRQGFGVDDYFTTANEQSLLIVLIEDIVAVRNLDEILEVDHIDVFFCSTFRFSGLDGVHPRSTKPGSSTHRRRYVAAHSKTRARGGHPCQRRFSRKVLCRRSTILVHGDGTLDDLGSTKLQKQWRSRPKTTGVIASRLTLLDINRLQLLSRLKCRLHGS